MHSDRGRHPAHGPGVLRVGGALPGRAPARRLPRRAGLRGADAAARRADRGDARVRAHPVQERASPPAPVHPSDVARLNKRPTALPPVRRIVPGRRRSVPEAVRARARRARPRAHGRGRVPGVPGRGRVRRPERCEPIPPVPVLRPEPDPHRTQSTSGNARRSSSRRRGPRSSPRPRRRTRSSRAGSGS